MSQFSSGCAGLSEGVTKKEANFVKSQNCFSTATETKYMGVCWREQCRVLLICSIKIVLGGEDIVVVVVVKLPRQ